MSRERPLIVNRETAAVDSSKCLLNVAADCKIFFWCPASVTPSTKFVTLDRSNAVGYWDILIPANWTQFDSYHVRGQVVGRREQVNFRQRTARRQDVESIKCHSNCYKMNNNVRALARNLVENTTTTVATLLQVNEDLQRKSDEKERQNASLKKEVGVLGQQLEEKTEELDDITGQLEKKTK